MLGQSESSQFIKDIQKISIQDDDASKGIMLSMQVDRAKILREQKRMEDKIKIKKIYQNRDHYRQQFNTSSDKHRKMNESKNIIETLRSIEREQYLKDHLKDLRLDNIKYKDKIIKLNKNFYASA